MKRRQALQNLSIFAASECSLENVAPKLRYYEFLYMVAHQIGDKKGLRKLLDHVDEEKIGMHPDGIKTSLQLLQCMLENETIRPDNVDELIKMLKDSGQDSIVQYILNCRIETRSSGTCHVSANCCILVEIVCQVQ